VALEPVHPGCIVPSRMNPKSETREIAESVLRLLSRSDALEVAATMRRAAELIERCHDAEAETQSYCAHVLSLHLAPCALSSPKLN